MNMFPCASFVVAAPTVGRACFGSGGFVYDQDVGRHNRIQFVHPITRETLSPTMIKFGAPGSMVHDYVHWSVLLRPKQVTLGSLVLIAKEPATAWPMLGAAAFEELKAITADIEQALRRCFDHDKINYLMLMMVDPDVHFHVIPRFSTSRTFQGVEFSDPGWPGPPRLDSAAETGEIVNNSLRDQLVRSWQN